MKSKLRFMTLFAASLLVLLGYQNCSQVSGFLTEIDPETTLSPSSVPPTDTAGNSSPQEQNSSPSSASSSSSQTGELFGSYRVYYNLSVEPAVALEGMTEAEALRNCQRNASLNGVGGSDPNFAAKAILCTWNDKTILEKYNGECSTTDNVCRHGTLSDLPDTAENSRYNCLGAGGGSNAVCTHSFTDPDLTGVSNVYLNIETVPILMNANVTEAAALSACLLTGRKNPEVALKCFWNNVVLLDRPPLAQCSTTVNTCRQGIFSDIQDLPNKNQWLCSTLAGGPNLTCTTITNTPGPVATFRIYVADRITPEVTTADISEAEALANCLLNAKGNLGTPLRCTWGTAVLMDSSAGFFPPGYAP